MSSNILYKKPMCRYDPAVNDFVYSTDQFCLFVDTVDPNIPTLHPGMSMEELKSITRMRLRGEDIYVHVKPDLVESIRSLSPSTLNGSNSSDNSDFTVSSNKNESELSQQSMDEQTSFPDSSVHDQNFYPYNDSLSKNSCNCSDEVTSDDTFQMNETSSSN